MYFSTSSGQIRKTFSGKFQVLLIHKGKVIGPAEGCVIDNETFFDFEIFQDFELLS